MTHGDDGPRPGDDPERTEVLVRRARADDEGAIQALFARYWPELRRALGRRLGDRYRRRIGDSEDAAQDAMLAALASLHTFEFRHEGAFMAWLLLVAERRVLERLRADRAQKRGGGREPGAIDTVVAAGLADGGDSPSAVARGDELEDRVRAAIDTLPEAEQEVLVLSRYLGKESPEIAQLMDLPSPAAARALLGRARARLATVLDVDG